MNARDVRFGSVAREALCKGVDALADAIALTLGPRSRSVLIQRDWGAPLVCNDGVTVAREARWKDPVENMGAQLLRQAAERTAETVGDGTSTSAVLARALYIGGVRNVAAGASAVELRRGMEKALLTAVATLRSLSRPVTTRLEKAQVAAISAHNDAVIGDLVADALEKVGDEGVITVEESRTTETSLVVVEGMQFDRGWLSHYFVTDAAKREAVLEQAFILVCHQRLSALQPLVSILEEVAKSGKPLLVIAEDVEGDVLATLVLNQLHGVLRCVAVKAPAYGERRTAILEDIATLTGATVISDSGGMRLADLSLSHLGRAERCIIARDTTTLLGGGGDRPAIEQRVSLLREEIKAARSDYDREALQTRLARLTGGVALIRVGATVESELKVRRDAFDDAIAATRAAIQEGIVPGGGLALLQCIQPLEKAESEWQGDVRTGYQLVRYALSAPARQIAVNSGADGGVVVARSMESPAGVGFDAAEGQYRHLAEAGIIDPTRVVRIALENAVAVAGLLLLSEAVMVTVPEEQQDPRAEPVV
jgi:chaperonin GroEL